MRKRFEQQKELDAILIPDVKIDGKSRHELPQLLAGLQYIFITPELNEKIFSILEEKILGDKKATGRLGMSLWEILVLGTARLNLDMDYDSIYDLSNNHEVLRGILGVHTRQVFGEGKYYPLQTLKDNVRLLDEQTLQQISEVVVKGGHALKKNEGEDLELHFKSDSYVIESTVHFPTDMNLLWDSVRKTLDVVDKFLKLYSIARWRKRKYWYRTIKNKYLLCANIHQRKGKDYKKRLKEATEDYLTACKKHSEAISQSMESLMGLAAADMIAQILLEELTRYHQMVDKHIDLVERRIIKGEQIPHSEKVFSIFEPHVEWIQKGKHHKGVELGHPGLITTDQFGFIVDHKVLVGQSDAAQPIDLARRLKNRFKEGYVLGSMSLDRGFYSLLAKKELQTIFCKVIMPKKGKKTYVQQEEEREKTFVAFRKKHSAIESNINELEQGGVNRVPDKGLEGFKKYVAWGVLAYNVKRLGKLVMEQKCLTTVIQPGKQRQKAA